MCNGSLALMTILILTLIVIVFSNVLSASCDDTYQAAFYILLSFELAMYIVTCWFGVLILRHMD